MNEMSELWSGIGLAITLAISFLLSGMEAGLFALSPMRIRQHMRKGRASAAVLHRLLQQPEDFLWTILVGNTIANFIAISLLVVLLHSILTRWIFLAALIAVVFLVYALADLLPKMIFRQYPNRLCLLMARPFQLVYTLLHPLVSVLTRLARVLMRWSGGRTTVGKVFGTRDEMRQVMQESAQAFSTEEKTMINRVMDLQNITARQVALPMDKAVLLPVTATEKEAVARANETGVSRFPVFENNPGQIVGTISVDALLFDPSVNSDRPIRERLQPAVFVDAEARVEEVLRRMQRNGQRMSVVRTAQGTPVGILTWQEALKIIFGEVSL